MDVSVIIPAYNYGHYLADALESVLAQTHGDWECLVVDDASTDDTAAVVERYAARDARIRYLRQERNRGVSAARNRGLDESRGRYVQFLDADDRLLPGKLARHVAFLDAHPETGIVYCEAGFFRSDAPDVLRPSLHGRLSRSILARIHGSEEAWRKLEHYNILPTPCALVRREVAGRFAETTAGFEDWDFWLRCAAAGVRFDFDGDDAPAVAVRAHERSASRDPRKMLRGLIAAAKAFPPGHRLPLIYEVALGVAAVMEGDRLAGSRRIAAAARRASESLTARRWQAYAVAARLLPRGLFLRFVAMPMPEWPLELYRRLRS